MIYHPKKSNQRQFYNYNNTMLTDVTRFWHFNLLYLFLFSHIMVIIMELYETVIQLRGLATFKTRSNRQLSGTEEPIIHSRHHYSTLFNYRKHVHKNKLWRRNYCYFCGCKLKVDVIFLEDLFAIFIIRDSFRIPVYSILPSAFSHNNSLGLNYSALIEL